MSSGNNLRADFKCCFLPFVGCHYRVFYLLYNDVADAVVRICRFGLQCHKYSSS